MRFSAAKETLILVPISRTDIEAGDVSSVAARLGMLSADRASALSAEGQVALMFEGYDLDPRPPHAIPEVRSWFAKLNAAWSYWSFFLCRTDDAVGLAIALLLPGESVRGDEPHMHGWAVDLNELKPLLFRMIATQNDLVDRLEIDEAVSERSWFDFMEAVGAAMELV